MYYMQESPQIRIRGIFHIVAMNPTIVNEITQIQISVSDCLAEIILYTTCIRGGRVNFYLDVEHIKNFVAKKTILI